MLNNETNRKMLKGNKVAKSTNKRETEFYTGVISEVKKNKALVKFEKRGFSRWCNINNLYLVD